jgi:hypothetical protein
MDRGARSEGATGPLGVQTGSTRHAHTDIDSATRVVRMKKLGAGEQGTDGLNARLRRDRRRVRSLGKGLFTDLSTAI